MTEGCVPEKSIAHRMVQVPWSFLWDAPGNSLGSVVQSFKVDNRMDTSDCFVVYFLFPKDGMHFVSHVP